MTNTLERDAKRGQDATESAMQQVAEEHAHGLALELECVLSDYSGKWYDSAINKLAAYREAMNAIHERESPTFMGDLSVIDMQHRAERAPLFDHKDSNEQSR